MKIEINRRTGRTTRIVNFAVEQLHSVGEVIVTDHTVFEYPGANTKDNLIHLVELVKQKVNSLEIKYEFIMIGGFNYVKLSILKLKSKENE
jgi:hypothetical protein